MRNKEVSYCMKLNEFIVSRFYLSVVGLFIRGMKEKLCKGDLCL